jgi:hypothetical protein
VHVQGRSRLPRWSAPKAQDGRQRRSFIVLRRNLGPDLDNLARFTSAAPPADRPAAHRCSVGPDCTVTIDSQHNLIIDIDTGIDNRCRALSTTAAQPVLTHLALKGSTS